MDKLRYVFDAVRVIRRELDGKVPLIGFAGSPWTIACYMVEGQGSDDYRLIKTMLYARPDLLHHILEINAQATLQYLNAQIDAGAQAVMLFDSWGGVLADGLFQQFSLAYTRKVVAGLKRENEGRRVPVIVFTKGGGQWLEQIAACGCDAVGWTGPWTGGGASPHRRLGCVPGQPGSHGAVLRRRRHPDRGAPGAGRVRPGRQRGMCSIWGMAFHASRLLKP